MKRLIIPLALLGLIMVSGATPLAITNAAPWPNLPSTVVHLMVVDGTTSYFKSTLSSVPAGLDVLNGVYPGWCIDRETTMVRSVSHDVRLYSSLTPPASVSGINWRAINYILNHKQSTMMDVQRAIWHFTDGYTATGFALAMVNAANANPSYDPTTHPILTVICLSQTSSGVQDTIIELRHGLCGLSPGFWKHNVKVYNGGPGSYSVQSPGIPRETDASMLGYAETILVNHAGEMPSGVDTPREVLQWANGMFQSKVKADKAMWLTIANWFNQAAGRLPYVSN